MDKNSFYSKYIDQINNISKVKPKLLLHVCCGPCSTFPLKELLKNFDITIFYSNSNIFPKSEYRKRIEELYKVINFYKKNFNNISFIEDKYNPEEFLKIQYPFRISKEGGARCEVCIKYRLRRTYDYAKAHGFDYFCSVMTVSQNKNSRLINEIGDEISKNNNKPIFLFSDFKKKNGLEEGIKIAKKLNLYRQNYCGCELSFHEMESRVFMKNNENSKKCSKNTTIK